MNLRSLERQLAECDTESLGQTLSEYGIEPMDTMTLVNYYKPKPAPLTKPLTPKQYGQALLNRKRKKR